MALVACSVNKDSCLAVQEPFKWPLFQALPQLNYNHQSKNEFLQTLVNFSEFILHACHANTTAISSLNLLSIVSSCLQRAFRYTCLYLRLKNVIKKNI